MPRDAKNSRVMPSPSKSVPAAKKSPEGAVQGTKTQSSLTMPSTSGRVMSPKPHRAFCQKWLRTTMLDIWRKVKSEEACAQPVASLLSTRGGPRLPLHIHDVEHARAGGVHHGPLVVRDAPTAHGARQYLVAEFPVQLERPRVRCEPVQSELRSLCFATASLGYKPHLHLLPTNRRILDTCPHPPVALHKRLSVFIELCDGRVNHACFLHCSRVSCV